MYSRLSADLVNLHCVVANNGYSETVPCRWHAGFHAGQRHSRLTEELRMTDARPASSWRLDSVNCSQHIFSVVLTIIIIIIIINFIIIIIKIISRCCCCCCSSRNITHSSRIFFQILQTYHPSEHAKGTVCANVIQLLLSNATEPIVTEYFIA